MACMTKLVMFTEIPGMQRNETAIFVEDIGAFFEWWISAPVLEIKLEVPGEFENISVREKLEKKLQGVMTE
jgi:hypothetical protein